MSSPERAAPKALQTPIQYLKGVGPQRAKLLEKLELTTARDVLFYFPRDYEDLSERRTIDQLQEGVAASVIGEVDSFEQRQGGGGRTIFGVLLRQGQSFCRAVWFNQPFMSKRFRVGQNVMFSGTPKRRGMSWEFIHPKVTLFDPESANESQILPIYPLTAGLKQHQIRKVTRHAVENYAGLVPEVFPEVYRLEKGLESIQDALCEIHQPSCRAALDRARYRLVYQELFVMQLALATRQRQLSVRQKAVQLPLDVRIDGRIRRLFPFRFTPDQDRAIREITDDLSQPTPMNRLLQGDVGTGKTAVAAYVMLLCVAHGAQAVLMAPTEVLANQHFRTLSEILSSSQVRIGYLSGSSPAKQKEQIVAAVAGGEIDLLIGTQAVIQRDLSFHRLGLVIIDEQHKFGVAQRAVLRQSKTDPHYLVMTATPIPRTIAMTVFGDLEVSALRQSPPGRQPVYTYLRDNTQRQRWWDFFRRKLIEGQQGFVISPVVDGQDDDTRSAEAILEHLANGELAEFRIDLLHGRMKPDHKLDVMRAFSDKATQVLVATSVVEVGVDVPNANLMTIEHGERFGLSQLHQLRGRVGRGEYPGYVCVFAEPTAEESLKRLEAFARTRDGFELAEIDFQLRGPGELFGTRQHGLPPLMVADLRRDREILQRARQDARHLIQQDPGLTNPAWSRLRRMVLRRYGHALNLSDVA